MLTNRITEGENRNFKTNLKLKFMLLFFLVAVVSFTHFKWLTFKELL